MDRVGAADRDKDESEERRERAFVIAKHPVHGYLLLKGFKAKKGLHGQLPGGNVDREDADRAAAAARELFEETGIDVRGQLDRLKVAVFPDGSISLKNRYYFRLRLTDQDGVKGSRTPDSGENFRLNLSKEHVGFVFEKDPLKAAELVALHSGGKNHFAMLHLECSS